MSIARRSFLASAGALLGASGITAKLISDEPPPVTQPRATSGDDVVEPAWTERLTVTVGTKEGELVGSTDKVIQAAVDYVSRLGGGTVQLAPGTYRFRNAVTLRSRVRLIGSGTDTICLKEPSVTTQLAVDSDWYDQEITLADPSGFKVGDGICLRTKNPHHGGVDVAKRTLVARDGARFKLDRALRQNFWLEGKTTVSTLFPILTGEEIAGVAIENLVLDGNRERNEHLDGNYAGCVFLQDCQRISMRGIEARNYNGDGLSWQICHDVVVENCHSHHHAGLGLHPGSGSQRPIMRKNRLEANQIGIFFCWGVKFGLADENTVVGNKCGISIGHRDTDNVIVGNTIRDSGDVAVLFRPERGKAFAPHRNRVVRNIIENNGPDASAAVDVQGETEGVQILSNTISDRRPDTGRIGIRIGATTREIDLAANKISGMAVAIEDLRTRK